MHGRSKVCGKRWKRLDIILYGHQYNEAVLSGGMKVTKKVGSFDIHFLHRSNSGRVRCEWKLGKLFLVLTTCPSPRADQPVWSGFPNVRRGNILSNVYTLMKNSFLVCSIYPSPIVYQASHLTHKSSSMDLCKGQRCVISNSRIKHS